MESQSFTKEQLIKDIQDLPVRKQKPLLRRLEKEGVTEGLLYALADAFDEDAARLEKIAHRNERIANWFKKLLLANWLEKSLERSKEEAKARRQGLFRQGFIITEFSTFLAFVTPLLCIILLLVEFTAYLWRPIAVVLYAALWPFSTIALIVLDNPPNKVNEKFDDTSIYVAFMVIGIICILVSFSQMSKHLYLWIGGFYAENANYWHWLRFGIANLLESALLDVPAIYEWKISEIRSTTLWSRTMLLVFRTSLELIVVVTIIRQLGIARRKWRNTPIIIPRRNYFLFIYHKVWVLVTGLVWLLPISIGIGGVVNDGLSFYSSWSAIKLGLPLIVSVWLAWQSLRAIALPGRWNKLLAIGGVMAGIWIIQESWPPFLKFLEQ